MTAEPTELILINATTELATATSIQEVKQIHNMAEAVRVMSKKVGKGLKDQNKAAEIKIRSERKLGQLLADIELGRGKRTDLVATCDHVKDDRPTLKDLGISKSDSSRWQTLASMPEAIFEGHIQKVVDAGKELTTAGMLRLAKSYQRMVIDVTPNNPEYQPSTYTTSFEDVRRSAPKFSCIYANPPWRYVDPECIDLQSDHHSIMTFDELSALPIKDIAAENAHLHLWAPEADLFNALWLINSWGFTFRGSFVWIRSGLGLGDYWRVSHETLLTAVRGDLPFRSHTLRSWQEFPDGLDDEKPAGVRRLIEAASPGPYLELFGQRAVPGWVVLGNQIPEPEKQEALSLPVD